VQFATLARTSHDHHFAASDTRQCRRLRTETTVIPRKFSRRNRLGATGSNTVRRRCPHPSSRATRTRAHAPGSRRNERTLHRYVDTASNCSRNDMERRRRQQQPTGIHSNSNNNHNNNKTSKSSPAVTSSNLSRCSTPARRCSRRRTPLRPETDTASFQSTSPRQNDGLRRRRSFQLRYPSARDRNDMR
jgi:hypothetical protein